MTIKGKLISILEGTYIEETVLTADEKEEIYELKKQLETERKKLPAKTEAERKQHEARLLNLETRINELRNKLYTRE